MQGWIKLYRKLLDNPIMTSNDSYLLQLWLYILLSVNHEDKRILFNGREITVKKGSGIFGLNQIVRDLTKLKNENKANFKNFKNLYYRRLKILANLQNVILQPTNKFTVISVVNWDKYQSNDTPEILQRYSSDTPVITNKNVKKEKNVKNNIVVNKFEEFWNLYPKKIGKGVAEKSYNKIKDLVNKEEAIIQGLHDYLNYWKLKKTDKQYIPNPATWLNQERWADELTDFKKFENQTSEKYNF